MNANDRARSELVYERRADWERDGELIRLLFKTTWRGHPITNKRYFDWQFREKPRGEGIGCCAIPVERSELCAGIYAVVPATILVADQRVDFSTSLYTMTHPDFYRMGIFGRLARKTYEECVRVGICGTIGIPNNKSLPGFTEALGFTTIGRFQLLARMARLPHTSDKSKQLKRILSEKDLSNLVFDLDMLKAKSGVVLAERSPDFISWRFLRCPGVRYHLVVAVDDSKVVRGMIVVRSAKKRRVPITVVLDFLVQETFSEAGAIAAALLSEADRLAWRHLSPVVMTLVNPSSYEAKLLSRQGFKKLPRVILPHDSNFIIKLHRDLPDDLKQRILDFENWYFSFADYDIF